MRTEPVEKKEKISLEQYFEQEIVSELKHEYVNGDVLDMAGASYRHNIIFKNLLISLELALNREDKSCFMIGSDQLLYVDECASIYYPDLMMICGEPVFYKDLQTSRAAIKNPTVIVEILSNSTQYIDRITKWACYKTIPSLKEYILINQYDYSIEKLERKGEKEWLLSEVNNLEDKIVVNQIEVSLKDVYKNTENLPLE
jgi:Uma2 family endonuclease